MKCPYCDHDLEKGMTSCGYCGENAGKMTPKEREQFVKVRKGLSKVFLVVFVLIALGIGILIFLGTRA
ncbi:MAG: hypothetical protein ABID64_00280 [Nitrospirota bacterium]